jgi:hypothetical protein
MASLPSGPVYRCCYEKLSCDHACDSSFRETKEQERAKGAKSFRRSFLPFFPLLFTEQLRIAQCRYSGELRVYSKDRAVRLHIPPGALPR